MQIDQYQLFLFDLDGLLIDTEPLHYAAYLEMSRRRGFPLNWDFETFCAQAHRKSMGFFDGLEKEYPSVFANGLSKEILYAEKQRIFAEMLPASSLKLMEGAEELLCHLLEKNSACAVVTNSVRATAEAVKKAIPLLQRIPLWIAREDYVKPKPSPEGYLKAIRTLSKPGDRVIGFEDSIKGIKALIAAGSEAVLVCPDGNNSIEEATQLGARHLAFLRLM